MNDDVKNEITADQALWHAALSALALQMSRANFETWLSRTALELNNDGVATIYVPNGFLVEWLESKYSCAILGALRKQDPRIEAIEFLKDDNLAERHSYTGTGLVQASAITLTDVALLQEKAQMLEMKAAHLDEKLAQILEFIRNHKCHE